ILSLADESLENLSRHDVVVPSMDIEVTSVAKQESTVGRSPAAIFVITSEMIRRSAATCVPELLRMVPGLAVARIDNSTWAITSRGFNSYMANKLLVLIDGRTVYTPIYAGVHWDSQDILLEDIERIEVIRGPGGTLWGANAVNGVINIITKKARDTQGVLATVGGGNVDRLVDAVRVGASNGRGLYWRVYGKHFERGTQFDATGAHDDWRVGRGGFRVDWEPCPHDVLTVQGDYYGGNAGHHKRYPDPSPPVYQNNVFENTPLAGAYVLSRWTHALDEESDWALQLYYDQFFRDVTIQKETVNTLDVDFQHRFPLAPRHRLIWGGGYRQIHDRLVTDGLVATFTPGERTTHLLTGFVQDEITLLPDRLTFTVGTKCETNSFTGFECQPSARVLYTPDRRHSVWAAVSRAVRTPSRFDDDVRALSDNMASPGSPFGIFGRLEGSREIESETLIAYEIGYRAQTTERFAWDVAAFIHAYEELHAARYGTPVFEGSNLILVAPLGNGVRGRTYGVELSGQWTISDYWRLSAWYSFLEMQLDTRPGFMADFHEPLYEDTTPQNQAFLQSWWDLGCGWEFDWQLRYVDSIQSVPSYITTDVRLGWKPRENVEISIVGQNLLDNHHPEFARNFVGFYIDHTEVRRSLSAKLTWRH
ncbi:MAG: TonB-dependent receptor, partial [Planctomycetes bacterium]|nr:TonB-dependent receptor [Planctomycetota bacterium]